MTIAPTEQITNDEILPFEGVADDGSHDRAALAGLAGAFLARGRCVVHGIALPADGVPPSRRTTQQRRLHDSLEPLSQRPVQLLKA